MESISSEQLPSLKKIERIANGLGVETAELFRFHHEEESEERLREELRKLIEQADRERLRDGLKLLRALLY